MSHGIEIQLLDTTERARRFAWKNMLCVFGLIDSTDNMNVFGPIAGEGIQ